MTAPSWEEMFQLGRTAGTAATRQEAEDIIQSLMVAVRGIREQSGLENQTAWALLAAIEGIRETMPKWNEEAK
ncbi:hypothetical protein UFOVP529_85 [uncultured Caudovirales phage]|uniref:Uncharacterized protein n=1 Tax=uncultured Caudovirales phage TaxID=2100421 RepID=A0A6J5MU42_9CAUD|nr:hypothetical protein UFOVP529_85 [uncultured Caudovirales phage]CAB4189937.1 hypothetical protein UFOVP1191_23 [uncultured Caudovirales phage]CAB4194389.1 hypothetical protein UFOVP1252_36 [uncultured Caudovirales phage]